MEKIDVKQKLQDFYNTTANPIMFTDKYMKSAEFKRGEEIKAEIIEYTTGLEEEVKRLKKDLRKSEDDRLSLANGTGF